MAALAGGGRTARAFPIGGVVDLAPIPLAGPVPAIAGGALTTATGMHVDYVAGRSVTKRARAARQYLLLAPATRSWREDRVAARAADSRQVSATASRSDPDRAPPGSRRCWDAAPPAPAVTSALPRSESTDEARGAPSPRRERRAYSDAVERRQLARVPGCQIVLCVLRRSVGARFHGAGRLPFPGGGGVGSDGAYELVRPVDPHLLDQSARSWRASANPAGSVGLWRSAAPVARSGRVLRAAAVLLEAHARGRPRDGLGLLPAASAGRAGGAPGRSAARVQTLTRPFVCGSAWGRA